MTNPTMTSWHGATETRTIGGHKLTVEEEDLLARRQTLGYVTVAAVADTDPLAGAGQGHCVHCGLHIILNDAGKWWHTLAGIYPCLPAWQPCWLR